MRHCIEGPSFARLQPSDCGAVALAYVMRHYGSCIPLDEVRAVCRITSAGATAHDIIRAARFFGFSAVGARIAASSDLRNVWPPAILHLRIGHFVVFQGIVGDSVAVEDPRDERRWRAWATFRRELSGIVIIVVPAVQGEVPV